MNSIEILIDKKQAYEQAIINIDNQDIESEVNARLEQHRQQIRDSIMQENSLLKVEYQHYVNLLNSLIVEMSQNEDVNEDLQQDDETQTEGVN